jgi:hypothetical protein
MGEIDKMEKLVISLIALTMTACEIIPGHRNTTIVGTQYITDEYINRKATIIQRVSVKLIHGLQNGEYLTPYSHNGAFSDVDDIIEQVEVANELLEENGSELGIDLVEVIDLIEEDYPGISSFHYVDWKCDKTCETYVVPNSEYETNWGYFLSLAKTGRFGWREDAVNVYLNGFPNSGGSSWIGRVYMGSRSSGTTLLHELGHGLGLSHTHIEDGCADTVLDNPSWTDKEIAQHNPGATTKQVQETAYNIMSYHHLRKGRRYFTECQIKKISETTKDPTYGNMFYSTLTNQ